ncbi:MAG: UbiA family prenyltransferase [Burkholderiaceae bacterium]|jgi:4-hydroxybenzoate polyprenyltransferase|nr:UbiA family prenyltransferase [Burkholderiaceae bacterium]
MKEPPLIIDLDGTLLRTDLLMETALVFVHEQPHRLLVPLQWLARGKASLKHELTNATDIDVAILPYDASVLEFLERERKRGRTTVLATASHHLLADQVATHLGLFDHVIATDGARNLSSHTKRDVLVEYFGERGFDYAGNSRDDLPVWEVAREAYVVNASRSVERRARALGNVAAVIGSPQATLRDWAKALRLHQWLKNLLIFVPLLAAHQYTNWSSFLEALTAFFAFGLCASSVYILNDLLDLNDDRRHVRKRSRPFASGQLPIRSGLIAFPLLLVIAFGLGTSLLPISFTLGLSCYYALTLAYSLWLKRRMVIDVMALAALYTLRIIVGAIALGIALSFWLLAFSMFLFLSLALVKRYAELFHVRTQSANNNKAHGRGYFAADLPMIASLGAASGYMAVMVLALYVNDAQTAQLYRHQQIIWFACPLMLTWISRVWMLAHRGVMDEDPVIFAVRDRPSLVVGALIALVFLAAT